MKGFGRYLPWLMVAVFGVYSLGGLRSSSSKRGDYDLREFGRLPVLLNGRVQPFDSVARNALLQIRRRQTVWLGEEGKMSAMEWLTQVMMKPAAADGLKVFRMDHPDVISLLNLAQDEKYFSFEELRPAIEELEKQARRVVAKPAAERTAFERQIYHAYQRQWLYLRLKETLKPEGVDDLAAEVAAYRAAIPAGVAAVRARELGQEYSEEDFKRLMGKIEALLGD